MRGASTRLQLTASSILTVSCLPKHPSASERRSKRHGLRGSNILLTSDYIHSYIQLRLGYLLVSLFASNPKYSVYSEPRIRVRNDIVRLLDICVLDYRPAPNTAPTQPPIVAIEIVSEDDRYSEILRKLREYHEWGVPHVWLIDPRSEQLAVYGANGFAQVEALTLPEFSFSVTLKELLPIE